MNRTGAVVAVLDVAGALAANVHAFCDPARGAVAVAVRPGARLSGWLAAEFTTQLGRTYGVVDRQRGARRSTPYALAALAAEGVTDLVVFHGEWLTPPGAAVDAFHLALTAGARLWLVANTFFPESLLEVLAAWDVSPIDAGAFTAAWNARPVEQAPNAPPTEASRPAAFPASLPADDFLTFSGPRPPGAHRLAVRRPLPPLPPGLRRGALRLRSRHPLGSRGVELAPADRRRAHDQRGGHRRRARLPGRRFRHGISVQVDLGRFL